VLVSRGPAEVAYIKQINVAHVAMKLRKHKITEVPDQTIGEFAVQCWPTVLDLFTSVVAKRTNELA
jgi:hypothetical protein